MKKAITPHLIRFTVGAILLTIVFRYFLSAGIQQHNVLLIIGSSTVYGLTMFFNGLYFGKKEGEFLPIYDVGFRFHLATFVTHNLISELWLFSGLAASVETPINTHLTILFWSIGLAAHFIIYNYARKHTIDHLDKRDLFE